MTCNHDPCNGTETPIVKSKTRQRNFNKFNMSSCLKKIHPRTLHVVINVFLSRVLPFEGWDRVIAASEGDPTNVPQTS